MFGFIDRMLKKIFEDPFAGSELVHKFSVRQNHVLCITIESRKDKKGISGIITISGGDCVSSNVLWYDDFKKFVNEICELRGRFPDEFDPEMRAENARD